MSDTLSPRAQRLRDSGFKLTHARLTVLKALETGEPHVTSSELLEEVSRLDPSIGRASVFRTLDLFTRLSIIRPTYMGGSIAPTYVLMPDGHHHHIICMNCNRVFEFEKCGLDSLTGELEARFDIQITGHLLELFGICAQCKQAMAESASHADQDEDR
ncbi:MAG: transcriptional repressor [Chloroflexi bacterium]|nr:transcriptional repressor [Chloroflexota bacterium]